MPLDHLITGLSGGLVAHHGLEMDTWEAYAIIERAAESTWPDVPGARKPPPPPLTRADWDRAFGAYDVVTDLGSVFAEQLIAQRLGVPITVYITSRMIERRELPLVRSASSACFGCLATASAKCSGRVPRRPAVTIKARSSPCESPPSP